MIQFHNYSIELRQPILTNFSSELESPKIYGLVATNGKGKTTFFRAILGLIPNQGGEVLIDGKKPSELREKIFYYESSDWFSPDISGLDYLNFVKRAWHSTVAVQSLVTFWEMEEWIDLPIKKYSLGMKQKVLISMYLVSDAEYLFMDEISNGLDEASREKLFGKIKEIAPNKTIMLTSHYASEIASVCDCILEIKDETIERKLG